MDYITFNEDAETVLNLLGKESIDLVVTSPPYDSLRKYNEDYEWNIDKCKRIISGLYHVLKPGGVVVWVVGDQTQKGSETGSSFKQALAFMESGFLLNDTMIWRKKNPMPQVKQPRYNQVFEYMFIFSPIHTRILQFLGGNRNCEAPFSHECSPNITTFFY